MPKGIARKQNFIRECGMRKIFMACVFSASVFVIGCGSDGGSSASGCGSKNLFSNWTYLGLTLSFSGMDFGSTYPYQVQFGSGEICGMDVVFNGNQCSGSTSVANAVYVSGGAGDPGCAAFNGPSTYTKSASGLEICDVGGCNTFQ